MSDIKAVLNSRSNNDYSLVKLVSEYIVLMETEPNNAVKKKSPQKTFIEQALIKKFKNIKKKSSSDSDNWSS